MDIDTDAEDLIEVFDHFVSEGYLEADSGAYWSAVAYAREGFDRLTRNQKYWVNSLIIPLLEKHSCPACGDLVPPGIAGCAYHQKG